MQKQVRPSPKRTAFIASLFLTLSLLLLAPLPLVHAQSAAPDSKAIKWSGEGLKLELQAMPLDLVRAFFLGRGFAAKDADFIAQTGCIFRSAIGNNGVTNSDQPIAIELANWRTIRASQRQAVRTRQDWAKIWETRTLSDSAKVAFHWALFPTTQNYQSSDYNWGMISFALPPGTRFDLEVHWLQGGVKKIKMLKNLECGK